VYQHAHQLNPRRLNRDIRFWRQPEPAWINPQAIVSSEPTTTLIMTAWLATQASSFLVNTDEARTNS
jgi:hypothetical protein